MTTTIPSMQNYWFDGRAFVKRTTSFAPFLILVVFFLTALYPIGATPMQSHPTQSNPGVSVAEYKLEPLPEQVQPQAATYIQHVNSSLSSVDAQTFAKYIIDSATTFKLDTSLLLALLAIESKFNPDAASKHGAIGFAQVIPRWHIERIKASRKITNSYSLYEPKLNIYVGAWALSDYIGESDSVDLGLLKYNGSVKDPKKSYSRMVLAEAKRVRDSFLNRTPKL